MQKAIDIIKGMIQEDLPEKDAGGVFIPLNVDENIRNNAFKECLAKLEYELNRS